MLVLWGDHIPYWKIGLPFALIGAGIGFAGTPASHSLTGSVPVHRVGMASGTADLQRDLGGAIMQSILGAILTAGYATSFANQIAASPQASSVSNSVTDQMEKSYAGAAQIAKAYPQYSDQIVAAAKQSFVDGQQWAYSVGVIAIGIGGLTVWKFFPNQEDEARLMAEYVSADAVAGPAA